MFQVRKTPFRLLTEIIINPVSAFEYLTKRKHYIIGFGIWITYCLMYLLSIAPAALSDGVSNNTSLVAVILINPKILLSTFGIFLFIYLENLLGQKIFNYQSAYKELLACNLFIFIVDILGIIFISALSYYSLAASIRFAEVAFSIWGAILNGLAVKSIFKASTGRTILIYLSAATAMIIISFAVKTLLS